MLPSGYGLLHFGQHVGLERKGEKRIKKDPIFFFFSVKTVVLRGCPESWKLPRDGNLEPWGMSRHCSLGMGTSQGHAGTWACRRAQFSRTVAGQDSGMRSWRLVSYGVAGAGTDGPEGNETGSWASTG